MYTECGLIKIEIKNEEMIVWLYVYVDSKKIM